MIDGPVASKIRLNELDAALLLDAKSAYLLAATSTVKVPSLVIEISAV